LILLSKCGPHWRCLLEFTPGMQEWCDISLAHALKQKLLHSRSKGRACEPLMDLVLSFLCDITRGLSHLHSHNIIHAGEDRALSHTPLFIA
jgi:hypothetical protein